MPEPLTHESRISFAEKSLLGSAALSCCKADMQTEALIHPITGENMPQATPAATVVIFRNNPDGGAPLMLMVERVKSMAFAGGAVVFPGGKVDPADFAFAQSLEHGLAIDEAAARLAAIRETIEEAGLALALEGVSEAADCVEARAALHAGETLEMVCAANGWTPMLGQLVPWARWRPPNIETRVFDTRFYLIDAGDSYLPAKVDNTENRSLFWDSAQGVLDRIARREVKAIFPTKRNLERLALFDSFDSVAAHAAEFPVELLLTYTEERDGTLHVCIPEGFGYPILSEPVTTALRG
jgi:8-oxo-dGTP pyrophosphatase MutT (NUDIX family)